MDEKTKIQMQYILDTISKLQDEKVIALIYQILVRLLNETK